MQQDILRVFRFTVRPLDENDPRSSGFLADARALGISNVKHIRVQDLYFIEGHLTPSDQVILADRLLSDPVTQAVDIHVLGEEASSAGEAWVVEVALRAGVTDPIAEQILRAAQVMHIQGVKRASTGLRFLIKGAALTQADIQLLAKRLLANPVTQRYELGVITPVISVRSGFFRPG